MITVNRISFLNSIFVNVILKKRFIVGFKTNLAWLPNYFMQTPLQLNRKIGMILS